MKTRGKTKFYILLSLFQVFLIVSVVVSLNSILAFAQEAETTISAEQYNLGIYIALSAAAAVGLSGIGAAYAIKTTGTAAISILSERPEEFMKAFLVVALGEALAIYGLIVAILLWSKLP